MLQANLFRDFEFELEQLEEPQPDSDGIVIKVEIAGICGSDLHAFEGKHPFVKPPIVMGHEFSGIIHQIGREVADSSLQVGQRVIVEPSITCGQCYNCRTGRYNICDHLKVIGCQIKGGYATYVKVPAANVIPLDDSLTYEDGAMIEPLAVAVHAVELGKVKAGDHIVIIGAGTIGLLVAQAAKAKGAKVAISDLQDSRLAIARQLGIDVQINSGKASIIDGLKMFAPDGADIIFECVGKAFTLRQSVEIARKGSRIVIVGVVEGDVSLPVHYIQDRELELLGDLMYTRKDFQQALELVQNKEVLLDPLKTKTYMLKDINEAFRYVLDNPADTLKVFLKIS
ncbi:zinc-dependent alcohol dehydrogenase [Paenibacillus senegalensis]|uniref:zinc-dependent alcohol dehydrogenase n=1 Tax=Paenibacillus senegalensis TaxID=1465766 RepID=UPI000288FA8C|nr:alcohol dehydrogenase catalytic domain-containing protein [Paenibacillus senegalensis]